MHLMRRRGWGFSLTSGRARRMISRARRMITSTRLAFTLRSPRLALPRWPPLLASRLSRKRQDDQMFCGTSPALLTCRSLPACERGRTRRDVHFSFSSSADSRSLPSWRSDDLGLGSPYPAEFAQSGQRPKVSSISFDGNCFFDSTTAPQPVPIFFPPPSLSGCSPQ